MEDLKFIDHIVYSVLDLEGACKQFEQLSGVKPVFGGYHTTQGTKNALVGLGNNQYLEFLAIDSMNTSIQPPRWMGIDLLTKSQITRLAVKSDNLSDDISILKKANPKMDKCSGGSRKSDDGTLLNWELSMPLATPEVEILPFLINWSAAQSHPSIQLSNYCKLIGLYATHPNPNTIQPTLKTLNVDFRIEQSETISIKAKLESPKGIIEL